MGITMTVTGRLGKPERPSFLSRRAHLLTTSSSQAPYLSPRRKRQVSLIALLLLSPQSRLCGAPCSAVVSLLLVGPRALPEVSTGCFSRGGRQCRRACEHRSSLPVRPADGFRLICIFAANHCHCLGTTCHPPAKTCHRQLSRSYGRCIPGTVHFLLSRQKKQNRPLQGAERK